MTNDWRKESEELLAANKWVEALNLLEEVVTNQPDDVEACIRFLYPLHEFVNQTISMFYENKDYDFWANKLLKYFQLSYDKFHYDHRYQFFMGWRLRISEWLFGLKNIDLALELQKMAWESEPQNKLYEWSHRFSNSLKSNENKLRAIELANYTLLKGEIERDWLINLGYAGSYILRMIKGTEKTLNYLYSIKK